MPDQISDMLTRIRNAAARQRPTVDVPQSRLKTEIVRILQNEGYIHGFKFVELPVVKRSYPDKMIRVFLKYGPRGERVLSGLERVSRPGRRVYFREGQGASRVGRSRDEHPDHATGRDDRTSGGRGRCGWRGSVQCLVADNVSNRKNANSGP